MTTIMEEIKRDNDEYKFPNEDLKTVEDFINEAEEQIRKHGAYNSRVFNSAVHLCLLDYLDNGREYIVDMGPQYILMYYCQLYLTEFKENHSEQDKETMRKILSPYKEYMDSDMKELLGGIE